MKWRSVNKNGNPARQLRTTHIKKTHELENRSLTHWIEGVNKCQ